MFGRKKNFIFNQTAFWLISVIALLFAYWFASMQVQMISADAYASYPKLYFLLTVGKCYLTIFVLFTLSHLLLSHASAGKAQVIGVALCYLPLVMVFGHWPMYWILLSTVCWQLIYLLTLLNKHDYDRLRKNYLIDGGILIFFFLCHFFLTSRFSPLHWDMALLTPKGFNSEEIPVVTPIYKGYLLAKQFSFAYVDHSQWAGVMNPPIPLSSPYMQLLTFIFDLPSISPHSFHIVIMTIFFTLFVLGSFGFYLFLRYAANIHVAFASLGGFLFFISGSPILNWSFISDGGIFLAPQAIFPYALLMITLAFNKNNYQFAVWAGVALASQFFFFAPHPEGTIYSLFFYGVYTLGLMLFSWRVDLWQKVKLALLSMVTFFALSAYVLVPMLYDQFMGNMIVFAHTGDVTAASIDIIKPYIKLLIFFTPLSLMLMWHYQKANSTYFSSLFLAFILLGFVYFITDVNLSLRLIQWTHIGIHFWVPTRIGVYFYTSVIIIAMYSMDGLAHAFLLGLKKQRHPYPLMDQI